MREILEYKETLKSVQRAESERQLSRTIDPLAYSPEFEKALLPKIMLFQATLDYVARQLKSMHQRRLLTRLEHNTFAMAWLAFEKANGLSLDLEDKEQLASAFLIQGLHAALQMNPDSTKRCTEIDLLFKQLNSSRNELKKTSNFIRWDDNQNLTDLLDLDSSRGIRLKDGKIIRKLHYICQLSVFTSTPKSPEDYPLTVLVSPEEFFSLSTMWPRKPFLWNRRALVTESGRLMISKLHSDIETNSRRDFGMLADLHLFLATSILKSF